MIKPDHIYELLKAEDIRFFTGVPDSLLKDFCAYVSDHTQEHVIAANEGNAIALAVGHFLGSGMPALVYMQNSGLGNAVNPLMSLADREVSGIPILLMIGWRGEPGVKDEPQHVKQGRIMIDLLDAMEIPWFILDAGTLDPDSVIQKAAALMREIKSPVALLIRKGAFEEYELKKKLVTDFAMNREDVVKTIVDLLGEVDVIVSTTGMASRELYECRTHRKDGHGNDFLTVGAMGHTASIAMGIAYAQTNRKVFCLDGDGSVIMHMGALAIIGQSGLRNFIHVVVNNGAHDSVGGQPTAGFFLDFQRVAKACGYKHVMSAVNCDEVSDVMKKFRTLEGPILFEVRVNKGSRPDLGRPETTPSENRDSLMRTLEVL